MEINMSERRHPMQPIIMLVLLTLTLAFGLTGLLGERLTPTAIAQVSPAPAPGEKASPDQTATQVTPSPDGIALSKGNWVYYLAPPGNRPRKLVQGLQPALSPDGKKLAYGLERKGTRAISGGGIYGLMVLDLATGQTATILPPLPRRIDHPAWSPRGDLLAFTYDREINIIHADGSGRQKIFTMPSAYNQTPQWASDGKSLFVNDLFHLFQIDLAGQELAKTPLTTFTDGKIAVSSADGFLLNPQTPQLWAFTGEAEGTSGTTNPLFLFDTRTQKRTRLTPADMSAYRPCWSRDGQYLYFLGSRGPLYTGREYPAQFYRINRDGTGLTQLGKGQSPSQ
jgi:dipeptidyl aminopeptidase/acylaminoacyl peptidase